MEALVSFMEKNRDIATGVCTKSQTKQRWENLSVDLNILGPPTRSWDKWVKVWIDFKSKTKIKSENAIELKTTGGGPNKLHSFSQIEEAVIDLLEINTCVDPPGIEFGLPTTEPRNLGRETQNGMSQVVNSNDVESCMETDLMSEISRVLPEQVGQNQARSSVSNVTPKNKQTSLKN